ncbi:hypothetical protein HRR83_009069 [Exophiala dermatitidis]|uniref:Altered inheritance of mitochondria protein 32 n=2 Tax=Exophiala dermatitidis TaxID=5970 RepID=H6BWS7_EXODN|nr:uncharacterized protein HMPREF1120_03412 [Exophiala dermatitidis NIH/UT8656]KAJ4506154.1 hypothetical protein HRR75_007009 [Exophiala dermatitidis]EHY55268.1 hypothetical protein HMPREF1120_03412 [Exophiala dermatitidis NIH/UT8656]KAJ4508242.1 hypothetical protein HRR74_007641 [Exophiala dermatitidis]KAJ4533244.1 hypothetical protein HRR77_008776 [Exophiala dermatitidis]KAJ4537952.1 hypothetical protein HRR78_008384 [Exophiala dermatitidis]
MPHLRPSLPRLAQSTGSNARAAARAALASKSPKPPFPVIPKCPAATCTCSLMPEGLDIDREKNLNGTMSPYSQHLIIPTGRSDWTSKIEDEKDTAVWGRFTAEIKTLLGRGGEFHDPYNNILISTSSFTPWELAKRKKTNTADGSVQREVDALLFPAFQHVRGLNLDADPDLPKKFVRSCLLPDPDRLHPVYKDMSETERLAKTRDPSAGKSLVLKSVEAPTILICSHGQRDSRCGILGPLLHGEFARYMGRRGGEIQLVPRSSEFVRRRADEAGSEDKDSNAEKDISSDEHVDFPDSPSSSISQSSSSGSRSSRPTDGKLKRINVNLGMVSHIGGHKWAGNVILYIPPNFTPDNGIKHPLAGMGIWYGRVEPRHVQGIIEQTLMQGKVIQELFRGGVARTGDILRL